MWRRLAHPRLVQPTCALATLTTLHCVSPLQRRRAPGTATSHWLYIKPVQCAPKKEWLTCVACGESSQRHCFSADQQRRSSRTCKTCASAALHAATSVNPAEFLTCVACGESVQRQCFSAAQINRSSRTCTSCSSKALAATTEVTPASRLTCSACGESLERQPFTLFQQPRSSRKCTACCPVGRPADELTRITPGDQSSECPHCKAQLFACERGAFCCGQSKHQVDFTAYFRPPGQNLLSIFASTWPHTDAKGVALHDARTNSPRLTGFSSMSRRFNNLFSLAMHEIHSTTS